MKVDRFLNIVVLIFLLSSLSFCVPYMEKIKAAGKLEEIKETNSTKDIKTKELEQTTNDLKKDKEIKKVETQVATTPKAKEKVEPKPQTKVETKVEKQVEKKIEEKEDENLTPRMKHFKGLFELVKEKRKGIDVILITKLENPFFIDPEILEAERAEKMKKLALLEDANKTKQVNIKFLGTFDSKANINGKWYKVNDKIGGYKLIKVNRSSIILLKNNKQKTISLRNKDGLKFN